MKGKAGYSWLLLCLGLLGGEAAAQSGARQRPEAQRTVAVVVVNAHVDPAQPVQAVRVSLSYVDGSSRITDARDVTNPRGEAWLQVSADVAQRGDVRIEVAGASDLVIYQPADGQLDALPPTVSVKLLPKGSPALLGPAQIEAMLHRSLLQVNSLARQNIALKGELAGAQSQRPDLSAAMAEWAKANGFATTDVDTKVQQWAEDIQRRAEQASVQQRALAELALKHYTAAAQLFGKAADADTAALDADDQAYVAKKRTDLTQLLKDSQQRANSLRLAPQYDDLMSPQNKVIGFVLSSTPYQEATRTLEVARDRAAAELKRFPEDQGLQAIWLHATASVANSSIEEAEVLSVDDSLPLLAQSADDYRSAVNGYHALGDRLAEGDADVGLGKALSVEGRRAGGDKAIELLDQAAQAYRSALEAYTKADLPQFGADIQRLAEGNADVELGYVLSDEGHRAGGEKAIELQDQAAQAYRSALEAYTKADFPDLWAYTQLDLGIALGEEGATASGDKAAALFDQAARAFRGALEVCTKADLPRDWAWIERDLGAALFDEGNFVAGDKAIAVFDQAVQAYQRSLEVYTKTDFPQDWARMQMLLGGAFEEEAKRATGDKAASLHTQADQAFQRAQEVK